MKKLTLEAKVGIFLILGIAFLTYMTVRVGDLRFGKKSGYSIFVDLDSAAGLEKSSPVRVAGVEIGRVESIELKGNKARLQLFLPSSVELSTDSKVFIKSEGLLGEKYIEIVSGDLKNSPIRPQGEIEQGASPVDIDKFFAKVNSLGDELKSAVRSISEFMGGGKGKVFSSPPIEIYAEFSNVGSLKKGSGVEIAGVEIGRVEDIVLEDYQAKVKLQIESTVEIQEDAIASVKTKGLFGNKCIEITPGGSEKIIPCGGKIRDTQPPFDLEKAISKLVFGKVSK